METSTASLLSPIPLILPIDRQHTSTTSSDRIEVGTNQLHNGGDHRPEEDQETTPLQQEAEEDPLAALVASDEDLLAALLSITDDLPDSNNGNEEENDSNGDPKADHSTATTANNSIDDSGSSTAAPTYEPLPELEQLLAGIQLVEDDNIGDEYRETGKDNDFFLDSTQLAALFLDSKKSNQNSSPLDEDVEFEDKNNEEEGNELLWWDNPEAEIDYDTELLYQALATLQQLDPNNTDNLRFPPQISGYNTSEEDSISGNDGLPDYFFCQPCTPEDADTLLDHNLDNLTDLDLTALDQDEELAFCQPCTPQDEKSLLSALIKPSLQASLLPPIDEDQVVQQQEEEQEEQAVLLQQQALQEEDPSSVDKKDNDVVDDDDLDDLLKLSLLQLDDTLDDEEFVTREMQAQEQAEFGGIRPEAAMAGQVYQDTFLKGTSKKKGGRSCMGHKETIFGATFSDCGTYCATASQDSQIQVWDVATNRRLCVMDEHDTGYECLRVTWASDHWADTTMDRTSGIFKHLIASSGADGVVKIWGSNDPTNKKAGFQCQVTLDHALLKHHADKMKVDAVLPDIKEGADEDGEDTKQGDEEQEQPTPDKPQVYSLQFVNHWQAFTNTKHKDDVKNSFLMTSSDDFIHFWEMETIPFDDRIDIVDNAKIQLLPDVLKIKEVMSLHFGPLDHYGYGVSVCTVSDAGLPLPAPPTYLGGTGEGFGGERNPEDLIFVFDACYCEENGLLGVALSDGSLRLVNGRGMCVSVLQLPGCKSHLTSFSWDKSGTRLATCIATGHLITWHLDLVAIQHNGNATATCSAIYDGGHAGRPVYGCRYCGEQEDLLLSWGVDGTLCMWDSFAYGNVHYPMAKLREDDNYPIYTVEISSQNVVAVGGGKDGGFIGVPFFLFDIPQVSKDQFMSDKVTPSDGAIDSEEIAPVAPEADDNGGGDESVSAEKKIVTSS